MSYFVRGSVAPVRDLPQGDHIRVLTHDACPYGDKCYRRRPHVCPRACHTSTDTIKPHTHWHVDGRWVIGAATHRTVAAHVSTSTPGYFLQSSATPVAGDRPIGASLGHTIKVIDITPCPHGHRCHRRRWYVGEYFQGGEYGCRRAKPDIHWHIFMGGKWDDDYGPAERLGETFI